MDAIAEIRRKLSNYPHLSFSETPTFIEVEAPSDEGFSVSLSVDEGEFTVAFDGWHQHFESANDAPQLLRLGTFGRVSDPGYLPRRHSGEFDR